MLCCILQHISQIILKKIPETQMLQNNKYLRSSVSTRKQFQAAENKVANMWFYS